MSDIDTLSPARRYLARCQERFDALTFILGERWTGKEWCCPVCLFVGVPGPKDSNYGYERTGARHYPRCDVPARLSRELWHELAESLRAAERLVRTEAQRA